MASRESLQLRTEVGLCLHRRRLGLNDPILRVLAVACIVTAIVLFYRYLKFFRIYSVEMFTTPLWLKEPPAK